MLMRLIPLLSHEEVTLEKWRFVSAFVLVHLQQSEKKKRKRKGKGRNLSS